MAKPAREKKTATPTADQLADAVLALNPTDDAHWTAEGLPDLTVLGESLGHRVTREEVQALGPLTRENAAGYKARKALDYPAADKYHADEVVKALETLQSACAASEEAQSDLKDLLDVALRNAADPFARVVLEASRLYRPGGQRTRELVRQRLGVQQKDSKEKPAAGDGT